MQRPADLDPSNSDVADDLQETVSSDLSSASASKLDLEEVVSPEHHGLR